MVDEHEQWSEKVRSQRFCSISTLPYAAHYVYLYNIYIRQVFLGFYFTFPWIETQLSRILLQLSIINSYTIISDSYILHRI